MKTNQSEENEALISSFFNTHFGSLTPLHRQFVQHQFKEYVKKNFKNGFDFGWDEKSIVNSIIRGYGLEETKENYNVILLLSI